jgi:ribosomal protein L40E
MAYPENSDKCPYCGYLNPPNSRYCQKCNNRLFQICLRCNTENSLSADYCKSCASNLGQAKPRFTYQQAKERWDSFCKQFPGYAALWKPEGFGHRIVDLCRAITRSNDSGPIEGSPAVMLVLPIYERDWCIQKVQIGTDEIFYGLVEADTFQLSIYDLAEKTRHTILYDNFARVKRVEDQLVLTTQTGTTLTFFFKLPRPAILSVLGMPLDPEINSPNHQDQPDPEIGQERVRPHIQDYRSQLEIVDAYLRSVLDLFDRIAAIAHKHKLQAKPSRQILNNTSPAYAEIVATISRYYEALDQNDLETARQFIKAGSPFTTLQESGNLNREEKMHEVVKAASLHKIFRIGESIEIRPDGCAEVRYLLRILFSAGEGLRNCEMEVECILDHLPQGWKISGESHSGFKVLDTAIGPRSNEFYEMCAKDYIKKLQKLPAEKFKIFAILDDYHSLNLARYYEDMLKQAGWQSLGISALPQDEPVSGVLFDEPMDKPVYRILLNAMWSIGLKYEWREVRNLAQVRIKIGIPTWNV